VIRRNCWQELTESITGFSLTESDQMAHSLNCRFSKWWMDGWMDRWKDG